MQHFDRVETSRTVQDLETEIIKKQKYIDEEERNHQSAEEVTRGYHDILGRFSEIVKNTTNIQKYNKHLNNAMLRRMTYIKEKRKFMASNTSQFFTQHLSQRGFSGHITFDHSQEVLELIVNVHKGPVGEHSERGVNQSTSKMRSLSGGERSVSTICFLTALWGAMESPFRCLDEFDVFMDLWNRKIVTKMVLELAMLPEQRNRQFIFLTPLDLSLTLKQSLHNVKILKLDDPR
ncbi:structural maintenance of chromosomes protein 6-like [Montipora capricornis]